MRSEACRANAEVHSRPWLRDWSTTSYSFGLTPGAVCCQNFYFGHKCLWHASCFLHRYYPQSYFYKSHAEINTIMELLEGQIIEGSPGGTTPVIWGDKAWEESNLSWRFILMSYGNENWHGRSDVWYDFSKIHIFGSERSPRHQDVTMFVRPVQVCLELEQSIFTILAQIFKQSVRNKSALKEHSKSTLRALWEHYESTQTAIREHSEHQNKSQYNRSL